MQRFAERPGWCPGHHRPQWLRGTAALGEEERQLLRGAWKVHRREGGDVRADDLGDKVGEVFEQFARDVLTARECEVARLLLEGHSNRSASQQLRIRQGTLKAHRRSPYEKLEIGSQSESFALFVRELKGGGGRSSV